MKKSIFPISVLAAIIPLCMQAQTESQALSIVDAINNSADNITVYQPASIDSLLVRSVPLAVSAAYQVEVFTSNDPATARDHAYACKAAIEQQFPSMQGYVVFESPYWSVRVGDFGTKSSASAALSEIRDAFPAYSTYLRIVKAKR